MMTPQDDCELDAGCTTCLPLVGGHTETTGEKRGATTAERDYGAATEIERLLNTHTLYN
jgi:hypothetical protein